MPTTQKPSAEQGASEPAPGRTLNPAKRALILSAAVESFLEHGYNAARMDAIGDVAGVSYATLYKHFPSKELLFEAAVEYVLSELYARWKTKPPPNGLHEGLTSIAETFVELVGDQRLVDITRVVIAQARVFPHLGHKLLIEARAPYTVRTDAWLEERAKQGQLKISDVAHARQEFLAILADAFFWPRLFVAAGAPTGKRAQAVIASAIDTFLARYGVA